MFKSLFILLTATALLVAPSVASDEHERRLQLVLGNLMDPFRPEEDVCENGKDADGVPQLGPCDLLKFPTCPTDHEFCFNRKPSRDEFFDDIHQPKFYIQYDRILCYPTGWACSSCTPGRYCSSEKRCIMEDREYECAQWL
ncbi:unnamed protein product [Cylindrotheca closterium]|uniref:PSI domain-containing protein n=1 Tax=Cylindrotheca closterium TaxID=2856 RepID=A0AAD2JHC5_9STRA|nr:unnamed protein product [Cylindrotheca closterium]